MYRLTRDDGAELCVSGNLWESALELGFLYGWKPVGTETPDTDAWRGRRPGLTSPVWDRSDYFSHHGQRVRAADARALSEAVLCALQHIPEVGPDEDRPSIVETAPTSPVPSRASAVADGLSISKGKLMRRFAAFANAGGFTIGGSA